jgi:hypothetical protein
MGNTISARAIPDEQNELNMSNGLTGVFFETFALSGSALAKTPREKELVTWFSGHDQMVFGLGMVSFDFEQIPWTKENFEEERQFLLAVMQGIKNKTNWELLDGEPNTEWLFPAVDDFCRLLLLYKAEYVNGEI